MPPVPRFIGRIAALGAALLSMSSTASYAVTPTPTPTSTPLNCDSGITISTSTTLTNDYIRTASSSTPCLSVSGNGTVVNLNGHTITRTDLDYNGNPTAIACTSTGTHIIGTGTIQGPFFYGIKNCEEIDGVNFVRHTDTGRDNYFLGPEISIYNESTAIKANSITNNFIKTNGAAGIESAMLQSTSTVSDNYVEAANAINVSGTTSGSGPLVENNIIRNYLYGLEKNDSTIVRFRKNLLMEVNTDLGGDCMHITLSGATITSNYCECPSWCPSTPPFSFPWY